MHQVAFLNLAKKNVRKIQESISLTTQIIDCKQNNANVALHASSYEQTRLHYRHKPTPRILLAPRSSSKHLVITAVIFVHPRDLSFRKGPFLLRFRAFVHMRHRFPQNFAVN